MSSNPVAVESVSLFDVPSTERVVTQAPLQWYGGKWEMADWLASLLPRATTFVMPFGGAGSPLWHVQPYPVEVYNDLDSELVNFFRVCRQSPEALARALDLTPFSREEFADCKKLDAVDPIERARQFAYVGRASHGGAWGRSWSHVIGHSRRGMSSSVSRFLHLPETVAQVGIRLKSVQVEHMPALDVIEKYDTADTLFYLDPPYAPETRNGSDVYRFEMTLDDHRALLVKIKACTGRWLISGYDCELYQNELAGLRRVEREVTCRSNITNRGAASKPKRTEVAWMNYDERGVRSASPAVAGQGLDGSV